ncbi:hypothetical protein CMALT430_150001 [Carnobacterium maltaromaticum]|nr:hypothetical protein CMALT430_150001 [Carnobacterium maltaromaticum]CAD5901432.1 hypothetical protein CMALT394_340003 [Carnobacterium maltaromaticum]
MKTVRRVKPCKGSNPLSSLVLNLYLSVACKESYNYRGVEQLAARRAHNPKVTGSSPVPAISLKLMLKRKVT